MPSPRPITDGMLKAIEAYPGTALDLAQRAGVAPSAITRFRQGQPLKSPTLDRLAAALNLRVVASRKGRR